VAATNAMADGSLTFLWCSW